MSLADFVDNRLGSLNSPVVHISAFRSFNSSVYECRVLLCPEQSGGFSAHALRLPGVASQGETVEEALQAVAEAFLGAIEAYREEGTEIPWSDEPCVERTPGCLERWVLVHA